MYFPCDLCWFIFDVVVYPINLIGCCKSWLLPDVHKVQVLSELSTYPLFISELSTYPLKICKLSQIRQIRQAKTNTRALRLSVGPGVGLSLLNLRIFECLIFQILRSLMIYLELLRNYLEIT